MGLRGPGAKPKSKKNIIDDNPRQVLPWEDGSLTRADKVIAFLEDLPITQGTLAGTKMKVRPWQRDFIEAVYALDEEGTRPVRTAVLSMARKNGKTGLAAGPRVRTTRRMLRGSERQVSGRQGLRGDRCHPRRAPRVGRAMQHYTVSERDRGVGGSRQGLDICGAVVGRGNQAWPVAVLQCRGRAGICAETRSL